MGAARGVRGEVVNGGLASTGGARKLNTLRRRDVPILFPSSRLSFEAWQLATELGTASLIEAVMLRRGIVHEFVIRLKNLSVDLIGSSGVSLYPNWSSASICHAGGSTMVVCRISLQNKSMLQSWRLCLSW